MMSRRAITVVGTLALAAFAVCLLPPIPQDPAYHAFADRRSWLGIPNTLDVASNLAFVVAGALGLVWVRRDGQGIVARTSYTVFFAGVLLTGFGSAFYHLAPDTQRLVWDRLPMTIAFTALVSATVSERVDARLGARLLAPLVWFGIASVVVWRETEVRGAGDLRLYGFVQFGALLTLVWVGALYRLPVHVRSPLVFVVGAYVVAKVLEHLDAELLAATGLVGGHTLKHLVAALAPVLVLWSLRSPTTVGSDESPASGDALRYGRERAAG